MFYVKLNSLTIFYTRFLNLSIEKNTALPRFLVFIERWGFCPKPRHKGLFVKSPLETQKLHKNKVVYSVQKFCGFSRGFFKSLLKQGPSRQFQLLTTKKKKHGVAVFFVYALNVGAIRPKPRHKGLFVKSPLETQKLRQNKVV